MQRQNQHSKLTVANNNKDNKRTPKGERVIPVIITEEQYSKFISDVKYARTLVLEQFKEHHQLFPEGMDNFKFNGFTSISSKMNLKKRQIIVKDVHYQLHPSFVLPDMRDKITDEITKGMLLRSHGVSLWLIVECFGKNESFWYCLTQSLSKNSIVGSTNYQPTAQVSENLSVDEKHIEIKGEKHYIATTVAQGCIMGAEIAEKADEEELTKSYGVFKDEATALNPDYQPKSINTDGWGATINSMKKLFEFAILIRCFLHAFLKIRNEAKRKIQEEFDLCAKLVWECYRADNKRSFSQRIRRLREWALANMKAVKMQKAVIKLCDRRNEFMSCFDNKNAHRTSNMLDRLMRLMDRKIFKAQGFHGSKEAANNGIRAFSLLHNFAPSCPKSRKEDLKSPAERLNGFAFSENWLKNLLIASSMNGRR